MREVPLSRGLVAIVDDEDFDRVTRLRWYATPVQQRERRFYAITSVASDGRSRTIYMHRLILNAGAKQIVDHANNDGLDNRRANIRIGTRSLNNANARWAVGKSGFRGVYQKSSRWSVQIWRDGQRHTIGSFADKEDAARAYDAAALAFFGDFATLNFPRPA